MKPKVFVITPFNDDFLALFSEMKNKFSEQYDFTNAGDLDNQQNILQDIVEGIYHSDVIIADLSGLNANVFYELGLAHAMNKKVIIITQDIGELPFDIKSYRANQYSLLFYKLPELFVELKKLLSGAIDGNIKYGNPVSDYIPDYFTKPSDAQFESTANTENTNSTTENIEDETPGEKGFLDYIAGIQENSENMSKEILLITEEMGDMNTSVNQATDEINKVKSSGNNTNAVFVRNVCRKLSSPIELFATKLKTHVGNISVYWEQVENDYLSMLENEHVRTPDNIKDLKESLTSLEEMQSTIYETDGKIESFIYALKPSLGMERKLSKSITMLITELEGYLSMTEKMSSSIDRITSKSEIVIKAEL